MQEAKDPKTGKVSLKTAFTPAEYEKEIIVLSEIELRKMGFGKSAVAGPGGSKLGPKVDYEQHL